jgi:hypothetical protein
VSIASAGNIVALVWAASQAGSPTEIYAATSRDGGRSFAEPVRVSGPDSPADVGGEQPPQVALAGVSTAPIITVVWTSKGKAGTRLFTATSTNSGKTFGSPAVVPGADAPGNRGWESIAVDSRGRVAAIWLDHRDMAHTGADAGAHGEHQHGAEGTASPSGAATIDGAARAQASQLMFATIGDAAPAHGVARGVCYCCKTALISGQGDAIYAAWRHVYPGNRRDIAFAVSRNGGRTFTEPVRVSDDGWQIDGCPENGPAMAVDSAQRVHVIWPTLVRDASGSSLRLFHASTSDGRTFTQRTAVPVSGAAYHPRLVTAADGSLVAAWDEVVNGARRTRLARGRPESSGRVTFTPLDFSTPAMYPALTATPDGVVLAWSAGATGGSRISVVRVPQ